MGKKEEYQKILKALRDRGVLSDDKKYGLMQEEILKLNEEQLKELKKKFSTKEKKLQRIKDSIKAEKITAYEIAKNTTLSEVGIHKILNGSIKSPNGSTLNAITLFLTGHYNFSEEWIDTGRGQEKEVVVPQDGSFQYMSETKRDSKINEIAVFIAHNEKEMLKNPIFKNLIERKTYEAVIMIIKSDDWKK